MWSLYRFSIAFLFRFSSCLSSFCIVRFAELEYAFRFDLQLKITSNEIKTINNRL
jgi:hypothetical protein